MRINDLNKVSTPESVQKQSSSVSATPKLQAGVGSIADSFETSVTPSLPDARQSKREQILTDMNEAKEYLEKLAEYNKAAEKMSEYLEEMAEASEELAAQEEGKEEDAAPVISSQATQGAAVKEAAQESRKIRLD
jgi:hypothetical protein